jgi:hypothetical protein
MTTLKTHRPQGPAVQVVLATLLAVLVAVTLWWGFVRDHAPLGPPGIRVEADFTGLPDGPAPTRFDSGQSATMVAGPDDAGDRLRIEHGQLTYRPTTHGKAGAFFSSPDLRSSVKGMGARFVFRPGSGTTGSITLVVSRGIDNRVPPMVTPLAAQFVVTPVNWYLALGHRRRGQLDPATQDRRRDRIRRATDDRRRSDHHRPARNAPRADRSALFRMAGQFCHFRTLLE